MNKNRVLHILSQRPALTGSGVTLEALVREAQINGWEQRVVVGVPQKKARVAVGDLDPSHIYTVTFGSAGAQLPFPIPGMSDVMPYTSSRFSALGGEQLAAYIAAWRRVIAEQVSLFKPDVIHCHHAWLVGASLKQIAPHIPVVIHGHGTGLRQLELCPHLADEVRRGIGQVEMLLALHRAQAAHYREALVLPSQRLQVVGAGYRQEVFFCQGREPIAEPTVLYAGKLSPAKGLPWLLDAVTRLAEQNPELRLHVVGSGSGREADALRERITSMAPMVISHGHVDQTRLARLLRRSHVFALSSFFEGLPLVLVEALACGCRAVCTDLPGIKDELAPRLGSDLIRIPLPRLDAVDRPREDDLPGFVDQLMTALAIALDRCEQQGPARVDLGAFTWRRVFARVEEVWRELIAGRQA